MRQEFTTLKEDVQAALDKSNEAYDMAQEALEAVQGDLTAFGVYMTEY